MRFCGLTLITEGLGFFYCLIFDYVDYSFGVTENNNPRIWKYARSYFDCALYDNMSKEECCDFIYKKWVESKRAIDIEMSRFWRRYKKSKNR